MCYIVNSLLAAAVLTCGLVYAQFDMPLYHRMPPINRVEEFHRCIYSTEGESVYCVVQTAIKPEPTSELWRQIAVFSNDTKRHYRHDILTTGLCLNQCMADLAKLSEYVQASLFVEKFDFDYKFTIEPSLFNNIEAFKQNYSELINKCMNLYLITKFNLKGYSEPILCETNETVKVPKADYLDITFLVVVFSILMATLAFTFIDRRFNQDGTLNYYKEPVTEKTFKWSCVISFSLPRNYYKLVQPLKNESERDLRCAQGIRLFFLYFILVSHSTIGYALEIAVNPEYYERSYHQLMPALLLNGVTYIQVFFAIAGYMLAVQVMSVAAAKIEERFRFYPLVVCYRYLRFLPLYGFLLLFNATYLNKMQDGAQWQRIGGLEQAYCRESWFMNIFYRVQGYDLSRMCMFHTYFIALEFQLFMIGLAIVMLIWRYPRVQAPLCTVITVLGVAASGLFTYIYDFDGVPVISPEERRVLTHQSYFKNFMAAIEPNAGAYFIGISCGMLYHKVKNTSVTKIRITVGYYLWYFLPLCGILATLSVQLFNEYDFEKPSLWMALYAMFSNNIWALTAASGALLLCFKRSSLISSFLNLPIFVPLYRLTYSTYLSHLTVLYLIAGATKGAINIGTLPLVLFSTSAFISAHFVSFILTLFIEYPTIGLLNQLFQRLGDKNTRYFNYLELAH